MKPFEEFYTQIGLYGLQRCLPQLETELERLNSDRLHGKREEWERLIKALPQHQAENIFLDQDLISIGAPEELQPDHRTLLRQLLLQLRPWRKGPFSIFGITIDTEWRSDWKWNRLSPHIQPLKGRRVLDVGCGSGYHCWRMLAAGAKSVLGIDPGQLSWFQFRVIKHFIGERPVQFLPIGIESFPKNCQSFDTVFSMGLLYHRKSPFEHLSELRGCLRSGGELVLETLVTEGDENHVLVPVNRYAQMRNVWCLPSPSATIKWLQRCGFHNCRMVHCEATTTAEQRSTEWMTFQSLSDFLDPQDSSRTIEGLPAPVRAIFLANK